MQTNQESVHAFEGTNLDASGSLAELASGMPLVLTGEHYIAVLRDAGGGRVWIDLIANVLPETKECIDALIAEEDRQHAGMSAVQPTQELADKLKNSLSIGDLAAELDVSRRAIERAVKDGVLVPTWHKGKRVRFSREYVDRLKERAHEARLRGFERIIGVAAATGPIVGAVQVRRPQMTAARRAKATLWKLQHAPRRNPQAKTADPLTRARPACPVERLTAEEVEARERLTADRAKLKAERVRKRTPEQERQIVLLNINPYMEPTSRDQALRTIFLLLRLVRAHPGEDAARIERALDSFRAALLRSSRRKLIPALATLNETIPCAQNLESQCVSVVHRALMNVVAWCERWPCRTGKR
jgi:hypothetical protein